MWLPGSFLASVREHPSAAHRAARCRVTCRQVTRPSAARVRSAPFWLPRASARPLARAKSPRCPPACQREVTWMPARGTPYGPCRLGAAACLPRPGILDRVRRSERERSGLEKEMGRVF